MDVCALILAAGEDKAMQSERTRFVHDICGRPMIQWISVALEEAGAKDQLYVVGYQQERVRHTLGEDKIYILQEAQRGTAHAVLMGSNFLESRVGCTLIVPGDAPLITSQSVKAIVAYFAKHKPAGIIATAETRTPGAAGGIERRQDGSLLALTEPMRDEFKQADVREIDAGIYCFDTALLLSFMGRMDWTNKDNLRIASLVNAMLSEGHKLLSYKLPYEETVGVGNRVALETVRRRMNRRICEKHMLNGVTIENPDSCFIEADVVLEKDVHVSSGCRLSGKSFVGARSVLGPRSYLNHATIGADCSLGGGQFFDCVLHDHVQIGINANVHHGVEIAQAAKIRDNVELSRCKLGKMTEIDSQTFISCCEIGESSFIGRGVITVDPLIMGDAGVAIAPEEEAYSQIGSGAEIGALSRLFRPFAIAEKTDILPGSIIRSSKRSLLPWGKK